MTRRARLGTWGFGPHPWVSVERTRRFYAAALGEAFELVDLDGPAASDDVGQVDAILSFHSSRWHRQPREHRPPVILAMHGGPVVDYPQLSRWLPSLGERDVLLVNCRADVEIVASLCEVPPRTIVLPLPVDDDCFAPYERDECRAEFGIGADEIVLGFVARLVPQKNFHGFLRVCAAVRERIGGRRLRALVIGTFAESYPILDYGCGAYPDTTRALVDALGLADSLCYFSAGLSDDQLAAAYCAMDLLVHPSQAIDENFGYVAIEAMACATPVVAAAYGGLRDSVVAGDTGLLIPTWATSSGPRMDLDAAAEAIVELLDDPERHADMAAAAYERARARYSRERCATILREAVAAACDAGEPGPGLRVRPSLAPGLPELLPETDPPYASLHVPISHYVSRPAPRLRPEQELRWAAPLAEDHRGVLRLVDPAWPARVELEPADRAWLRSCERPRPAAELAQPGSPAWTRLQQLVDDGLLIPSVEVLR